MFKPGDVLVIGNDMYRRGYLHKNQSIVFERYATDGLSFRCTHPDCSVNTHTTELYRKADPQPAPADLVNTIQSVISGFYMPAIKGEIVKIVTREVHTEVRAQIPPAIREVITEVVKGAIKDRAREIAEQILRDAL